MAVVAVRRGDWSRVDAARPRGLVGGTLLIAIAVAGFVGYAMPRLWSLRIADATLRPSLETGLAAGAIVGVILLVARFRQTRLLRDLLLLIAFAAVALADFVFHALPAYDLRASGYGAGAGIAMTILAAGAFVAVSFAPAQQRVTIRPRRVIVLASLATVGWIALGELLEIAVGVGLGRGPVGLDAPIWTAAALLCFVLLLVSGICFAYGHAADDTAAKLLTGAAVLLAGAELGTVGMPVAPADWVTPTDALRVGAFAMLIAVSVLLYRHSLRQTAREALAAERLRIAGDLHDGLAQDLAFIAAHSERLARVLGADHPVAIAAARALATSRGQIVDLEASSAPTTAAALRELAAEAHARFGVRITVDAPGADRSEPSGRERAELVRIAREAIVNAVRHGGARHITIRLGSAEEPVLLRVTDDGSGLPGPAERAAATSGTGLGMRAMRARARRIGAQLHVGRRAQGGTEVEIVRAAVDDRSDVQPRLPAAG